MRDKGITVSSLVIAVLVAMVGDVDFDPVRGRAPDGGQRAFGLLYPSGSQLAWSICSV